MDSVVPYCFKSRGNDSGEGEFVRHINVELQEEDGLLRGVVAHLLDAGQQEDPSQDVVWTLKIAVGERLLRVSQAEPVPPVAPVAPQPDLSTKT